MRFDRQYPAAVIGQKEQNISDALSRRDNRAVRQCVLDMQIFDVRREQLPGFHGILAALDKISGVKDSADIRKFSVEHGTSRGSVSVDALFVFVAEDDAAAGCRRAESVQA